VGFGGARHQTSHGHAGVLQLRTQHVSERIEKCLGSVVHRLVGTRHEPGNRAGDQDANLTATPHLSDDVLDQVHGTGDVRVDDVTYCTEVLVQEGTAEPSAGVGEQRGDGTTVDRCQKFVDSR